MLALIQKICYVLFKHKEASFLLIKDWTLSGFLMLHLQKNYPDSKPIAANCGVYGLGEQCENFKMRCKMKKLLPITFVLLFIWSCSKTEKTYNLRCTVVTQDNIQADSIYVEISVYDVLHYLKAQKDSVFLFNIVPGQYTIAVKQNGYDQIQKNIVVPDKKTNIDVRATLMPNSKEGDESKVVITGFDQLDKFFEIKNLRDLLRKYPTRRGKSKYEPDIWASIYQKVLAKYDSVSQDCDEILQPFLAKYHLNILYFYHPFSREMGFLNMNRDTDYDTLLLGLIKSKLFEDYFNQYMVTLRKLDKKSFLYESGGIGLQLSELDCHANLYPEILLRNNLDKDYFFNFIIALFNENPKENFSSVLMCFAGNNYGTWKEFEKSKEIITLLKEKYPKNANVTNGFANKVLLKATTSVGSKAPFFSAQTIDGNTINLNDYLGKFVFLEFWGTMCTNCMTEISYVVKLSEEISTDQLKIIGMMDDSREVASKFLTKNKLPYDNAIVDEKIMQTYGITSMPSSFLIGPDGSIVGKDLRGKNLVEEVQKYINEYRSN